MKPDPSVVSLHKVIQHVELWKVAANLADGPILSDFPQFQIKWACAVCKQLLRCRPCTTRACCIPWCRFPSWYAAQTCLTRTLCDLFVGRYVCSIPFVVRHCLPNSVFVPSCHLATPKLITPCLCRHHVFLFSRPPKHMVVSYSYITSFHCKE